MIKAFCRKGVFFSFILTGCLILFNVSCGLDTFYDLKAPNNVAHKPIYSSVDEIENYFEFFTIQSDTDNSGMMFLGTDVYYKIYKNPANLTSAVTSLQSLSNKDYNDKTSYSADSMIQKGFQPLRAAGQSGSVLVSGNVNKRVYIRLSNYNEYYSARITIGDDDSSSIGIPIRNIDSNSSFSFKEIKLTNPSLLPKSGDQDVNADNPSADYDNKWYVCMFALAVGRDAVTLTPVYSNILYLGSVTISAD